MLWQLQEHTGRRMHELFDLVCGTSTGGILAAALAVRCVSLEECEEIYRCKKPASCAASWLARLLTIEQSMRSENRLFMHSHEMHTDVHMNRNVWKQMLDVAGCWAPRCSRGRW